MTLAEHPAGIMKFLVARPFQNPPDSRAFIFLCLVSIAMPAAAIATVYTIRPADAPAVIYATIEGAACGDTVSIQGGVYSMANGNLARIYINNKACASNAPLTIQAADQANKPIFDYSGYALDGTTSPVPGSSPGTSSDNDRGAWQVHNSSYVVIDGLRIRGVSALTTDSAAALRFIRMNHFTIRRSILENSYNGLQGDGIDTTVEYDEFVGNGRPGSDQQHQLYDTGGDTLTVRYNYFHNMCSPCGQNMHFRSWHTYVYANWLQDASQYEWDMMTPNASYPAPADGAMRQQFYGNVVVTNPSPGNDTHVFAFYGDGGGFPGAMKLDAQWNTFWIRGQTGSGPGSSYNLFQLNVWAAATGAQLGEADLRLANNIVHFTGNMPCCNFAFSLYFAQGTNPWSVSGDNNWFDNFTINTCPAPNGSCFLSNSFSAGVPPFAGINALDLRPVDASHPFGSADLGQPLRPPYQQYPAGPGNLTALNSYADVGALQYAADPFMPKPPAAPRGLTLR